MKKPLMLVAFLNYVPIFYSRKKGVKKSEESHKNNGHTKHAFMFPLSVEH